jgi:hypothetical protein
MLVNPHALEDGCLYALATLPGDSNTYDGVVFSDGVARQVPGFFAKRLVGKVNPLYVFETDDELVWDNRVPSACSRVVVSAEELAATIEVLEDAVVVPAPKKRGRPKKKPN